MLAGNSANVTFLGWWNVTFWNGCWWPPTRGWKGHFESPGWWFSPTHFEKYAQSSAWKSHKSPLEKKAWESKNHEKPSFNGTYLLEHCFRIAKDQFKKLPRSLLFVTLVCEFWGWGGKSGVRGRYQISMCEASWRVLLVIYLWNSFLTPCQLLLCDFTRLPQNSTGGL